MLDRDFYTIILRLPPAWIVADVDLDLVGKRVIVRLKRQTGVGLECPKCRRACPGYDTQRRRWLYPPTCEFETRIEADVPRCLCTEHGVKQVQIPWERFAIHYPVAIIIGLSSIVLCVLGFYSLHLRNLALPVSSLAAGLGGIGIIVGIVRRETTAASVVFCIIGLVLGLIAIGISMLTSSGFGKAI